LCLSILQKVSKYSCQKLKPYLKSILFHKRPKRLWRKRMIVYNQFCNLMTFLFSTFLCNLWHNKVQYWNNMQYRTKGHIKCHNWHLRHVFGFQIHWHNYTKICNFQIKGPKTTIYKFIIQIFKSFQISLDLVDFFFNMQFFDVKSNSFVITSTRVGGSKSIEALKLSTSSNVHYLYMSFFYSLQQCGSSE